MEIFKQALDSLLANKLRSILTMLGIIMGVFSVIAIMAMGNATENYITDQFQKIGANVISVNYKESPSTNAEYMTLKDMDSMIEYIPEIKNIATAIQEYGTLRMDDKTRDAIVYGVSSQYKSFAPLDMAYGRFINSFDVTARAKVVVVDEFFAKRYFNRSDVVGEEIVMKLWDTRTKLKIIGVIASGEDLLNSFMDNEKVPTTVYMPIQTIQQIIGVEHLSSIMLTIDTDEDPVKVKNKVITILKNAHNNRDNYSASSSQDIQKLFGDTLRVITSVLLVIAIITLIVGGIGIINILLVSVTERIREIGIRKALGARKRDIVIQFLMESILMTGTSGIIGIIMGVVAGRVISSLIKIPPVVDVGISIAALVGSIVLGIIFGVYPAKKAADLDPIEALRYE